ncbi:hypothetical protein KP509_18G081300 [Ceratopteris richardii]|uniref:Uncharacterized protein n=1 Tax=Ceratopteris richardii TaxID=49495 RepID=A0A8T2SV23_CERRI|nr:hypothetical protein KP509_18G081300 [Ceratopteris richardii]
MLQQSVQNRADGSSCLFESHVAATTEVNQDAPEEIVWLADKDKCDVVVYVKERPDSGPPCKKRIVDVKDVQGESSIPRTQIEKKYAQSFQIVRIYTISERLAKSPYFRVCLKEPWSRKAHDEDGSVVRLHLETLLASPQGYRKCIEFLCSSQPCTPYIFSSPLEALDIYLASDHVLFKECADACMDFLSAVPWSNEDAKIIHRTFSNSSIVPSKEVAARLGLSKEKPISNLKDTLWDIYESCFYSEFDDSYPPAQLFRLIESLLQVPSRNSPNMWSRKAISEFLCEATNDAIEAMKLSEKDERMLMNKSFLSWLRMAELLLEITDGKESVMSVASDEDLCESLLPALRAFTERTYVQRTESTTIWTTIRQFVKLLIEIFKRVATAKVILSASARTSLVKRWVPWLESIRLNERLCDADDMPVLKTYIKSIIDTLGMDDGELLSFLAHASMRNDYFLEGALKSWCFRLDQSLYQGLHVESCNLE